MADDTYTYHAAATKSNKANFNMISCCDVSSRATLM